VCIVGAGVIGAAIAYELAKAGRRVIVTERAEPAAEASGITMAWVNVHHAHIKHFPYADDLPPYFIDLMRAALDAYDDLDSAIKDESEYLRTGGMSLIYDREQLKKDEQWANDFRERGLDVRVLSRDEVIAREPGIGGDFIAGIWCPREGVITSPRLVGGFLRRAEQAGAEVLSHTTVTGLLRDGSRVIGVETTAGRIHAGAVVNAAGMRAPEIAKLANVDVPMYPVRGQQVVLDGAAGLLNAPVYCHAPARPMPLGRLMVSGPPENVGYDNRVTFEGIGKMLVEWSRVFPKVADLTFLGATSGIRMVPKDRFPIFGAVPGVPGFYLASLHRGVTFAPLVGRLMSQLIITGTSSIPLEPYSVARFAS
jgi:sarcosine oxidase subunit beta